MALKKSLVSKNPNSRNTGSNSKKENLHLAGHNYQIRRTMYFSGKTLIVEDLKKEQNYLQKKRLKVKEKPLYIFNFPRISSKYVRETEKNLKDIFKMLRNSNGILLFDEADALFGKRSKIKDSHDKYANLEPSYILKKLQNYKGIKFIASKNQSDCSEFSISKLDYIICFPINNS